jgi:hypothetical protein
MLIIFVSQPKEVVPPLNARISMEIKGRQMLYIRNGLDIKAIILCIEMIGAEVSERT